MNYPLLSCRIITSDNIEFGVKNLKSSFLKNMLNSNDSSTEHYLSVPFNSSSVLDFIKYIQGEDNINSFSNVNFRLSKVFSSPLKYLLGNLS